MPCSESRILTSTCETDSWLVLYRSYTPWFSLVMCMTREGWYSLCVDTMFLMPFEPNLHLFLTEFTHFTFPKREISFHRSDSHSHEITPMLIHTHTHTLTMPIPAFTYLFEVRWVEWTHLFGFRSRPQSLAGAKHLSHVNNLINCKKRTWTVPKPQVKLSVGTQVLNSLILVEYEGRHILETLAHSPLCLMHLLCFLGDLQRSSSTVMSWTPSSLSYCECGRWVFTQNK